MGGRPRVCHLECGGHQTVMVDGEETAGHLTVDCADMAGPPRSAAPSLCGRFWASATSPNPLPLSQSPARAAYPHAAAQTRIVSVARIRLDLQIQGRAGDGLNARAPFCR